MTLHQEKSNNVSSRAKSRDLSQSILQTLKYSDHFGFPLTISEIQFRLVGARSSRPQLIRAVNQMLEQHHIENSGDYYFLPGRKSLVSRRLKRAKLSIPQLARAKRISASLSRVPGVIAVYLTGSLAMSNSGPDADIDFMIISRAHRLWTTRLLIVLYAELLGLRRHPNNPHTSGKICLNLYLTPDSYLLPKSKQSLYTAYELIQAVPLYDPQDTHSSLLSTNAWIKHYLPNFLFPAARRSDLVGCKPDHKPTRSDLIGILENILYHLQLFYMRPKLTREYITPDSAFFHPNNPAPKV